MTVTASRPWSKSSRPVKPNKAHCICAWWMVQGPAAGGEAGAEASVGAAQTGAAQGGGDGSTAALRPGDRAPQEAAEAGGGQDRDDYC